MRNIRAYSTIFRYFRNLHFYSIHSTPSFHLVHKKNNKFNAYEKRAFFKFSRDDFFYFFFAALNFVHISIKLLLFTCSQEPLIRWSIAHCNSIKTLLRKNKTIFIFLKIWFFSYEKSILVQPVTFSFFGPLVLYLLHR